MFDHFFTFSPNTKFFFLDDFVALTSSFVDMVLVSRGLKAGGIPIF